MMGVTRERDKGGGTLEHDLSGADGKTVQVVCDFHSSLNETTPEKATGSIVNPGVEGLRMVTKSPSKLPSPKIASPLSSFDVAMQSQKFGTLGAIRQPNSIDKVVEDAYEDFDNSMHKVQLDNAENALK